MKKLNSKAFWIVTLGLICCFIVSIINYATMDLDAYGTQMGLEREIVIAAIALGITIAFVLYSFVVYKLINNRKKIAPQGYITVVFILFIIGVCFNLLSLLIDFNVMVLITILAQGIVIYGTGIQRKEPFERLNQ